MPSQWALGLAFRLEFNGERDPGVGLKLRASQRRIELCGGQVRLQAARL